MRKYRVELVSKQPLLMHPDNVEWSDQMDAWKNDKDNKKFSKAGDDRSPAWRWLGNVYHDKTNIVIPSDNIMSCFMEAGASVLVPGGRSGKTFKSQTQSGILCSDVYWPLLIGDKTIPWKPLQALLGEKDFEKHKAVAKELGFELFIKRAKIGASKHVRVRPRFERWSTIGELTVVDEQITTSVLTDIAEIGGHYKGLGDWRPSSPKKPGSFGMFSVTVTELAVDQKMAA
jgi:hypothetical protein